MPSLIDPRDIALILLFLLPPVSLLFPTPKNNFKDKGVSNGL